MNVPRIILPKDGGDGGMLHFWVFERRGEPGGHMKSVQRTVQQDLRFARSHPQIPRPTQSIRQHPTSHEHWISPSAPYPLTIEPYSLQNYHPLPM